MTLHYERERTVHGSGIIEDLPLLADDRVVSFGTTRPAGKGVLRVRGGARTLGWEWDYTPGGESTGTQGAAAARFSRHHGVRAPSSIVGPVLGFPVIP